MGLDAPAIAGDAEPGQFIHIRVNDGTEPLLRRPFGVHKVNSKSFEILYEVVGKGTGILSKKRAGEYLDVIGPLGNGFNYRTGRPAILVAGGMGTAPLVFLAEKLKGIESLVLIGAKTKEYITCEKEFCKLGCDVKTATDDGSKGFRGKVTDLLRDVLRKSAITQELNNSITLYACGPHAMLKEVAQIAHKNKIPCQVSLEELFACGVGACLGCAVKVRQRTNGLTNQRIDGTYKLVCKDGPVFDACEISW